MPEDITTANIEDTILRQNPELTLQKGSKVAKFIYFINRKHRNAVVEVGAEIRRILQDKKVRLGWQICKTDNYLQQLDALNARISITVPKTAEGKLPLPYVQAHTL